MVRLTVECQKAAVYLDQIIFGPTVQLVYWKPLVWTEKPDSGFMTRLKLIISYSH